MERITQIEVVAHAESKAILRSLAKPYRPLDALGHVSLSLNGACYPTEEWDDFVFLCITAWLDGLVDVTERGEGMADFLDDVYAVHWTRSGNSPLLRGRLVRSPLHFEEFEVELRAFGQSLLDASRRLISQVEEVAPSIVKHSGSRDLARLKTLHERLGALRPATLGD